MIIIKSRTEENLRLINVETPYYLEQQENCIYICKLGEPIDSFQRLVGEFISEEIALSVMKAIESHIEYVNYEKDANIIYDMPCKFGDLKVGMQLMDEEFNRWQIENRDHRLYVVCDDLMAMEKVKDFDFTHLSLVKLEVKPDA